MFARGKIALSCALALAGGGLTADAAEREATFVRATQSTAAQGEAVRELYPSGALKVERHVERDAEGRTVNHGAWSMFAEDGRLLGGGSYTHDVRQGKWIRSFAAGEAELLDSELARGFTAPFESQVNFTDGQMHGVWRIVDAEGREVLAFSYERGRRHGPSVWRYPNGQPWREMTYFRDVLDGKLVEWSEQGQVLVSETYIDGRRLAEKVEHYPSGAKKVEAQFLLAKHVVEHTDHWWNGISRERLAGVEGLDERHGSHVVWYENGQKAQEGNFEHDAPHGTFAWWYADGIRAIEGHYEFGHQVGTWAWWYPSGDVRIQGHYVDGRQQGGWTWWTAGGQIADQRVFNGPGSATLASGTQREPLPPAPPIPADDEEPSRASAAPKLLKKRAVHR